METYIITTKDILHSAVVSSGQKSAAARTNYQHYKCVYDIYYLPISHYLLQLYVITQR